MGMTPDDPDIQGDALDTYLDNYYKRPWYVRWGFFLSLLVVGVIHVVCHPIKTIQWFINAWIKARMFYKLILLITGAVLLLTFLVIASIVLHIIAWVF